MSRLKLATPKTLLHHDPAEFKGGILLNTCRDSDQPV
jgi:hypothetical protein